MFPIKYSIQYHKIPLMGCPNQLNHVKSMEIPTFSDAHLGPPSPKTIQQPLRLQPRGALWLQHLHLRTREERLDATLQRRNVGVVFEVPRPGLIVVLPADGVTGVIHGITSGKNTCPKRCRKNRK